MMSRNFKKLILLMMSFILCLTDVSAKRKSEYSYLYDNLPFEMPVLLSPVFPKNKVTITDFGAVPDGITLNTSAFNKAIDVLSAKGGGTVIVPAGVWFTGPIVLKSNINLQLEKGSLILFSPDKKLYPLVDIIFEGLNTFRCQSPISGRNLVNVAITGQGAIDGNGQYWRPLKKQKVTDAEWKDLTSSGGAYYAPDFWMPSEQYVKGQKISGMNVPTGLKSIEEFEAVRDFMRPVMVSFYECKNVFLKGVLFQNSPAWNIHPLMCEHVIIDNIQVRNPSYAQNGDGLDVESCKNVIVVNSTFDCGDDGICIKSGKDEDGRRNARPCENIIVDNCKVFKGHGGFVVGSEMSGGVRNIKVSNCNFLGTDVGLRFKSTRGRGGIVENIYIENISMMDIKTEPILFDLFYGGKSAVEVLAGSSVNDMKIPKVDETTPSFRNIYIKNLTCSKARRAMYFNGLPEMNIKNIQVENVTITADLGAELCESEDIVLKNIRIFPKTGPALQLFNVKNFRMKDFVTHPDVHQAVLLKGDNNQDINLKCDQ